MVKIIGIFAIVFMCYCEINAEVDNFQYRKTATAGVRRILSVKKKSAGDKSGGIWLRSNAAHPNAKFTMGFREDIRGPHKEYVLRNGEARYNDLEHHLVKKRRFKRNYRDEESKQIDEHDSVSQKPKKKKKHYHSSMKMNKNLNSTRNKKTKRYKNDTKRNDMEEKDNEDRNKKHHYHSGRKMNKTNNSTRNKIAKRYKNKNEDRNKNKDEKQKKENNHGGKRNRDKDHGKYSEHPKKEKDHIDKKKQAKDKSKDKKIEKSIDRNKHVTIRGPIGISKTAKMRFDNENNHKHNKKKIINKSNEKQKENSKHTIDTTKTAIGMAGLGAADVAALLAKSLASIKDLKLQPEQVLTSTTTPKPSPEPVLEQKVVRKNKLFKRERLNLRTKEEIRSTRMVPFSMNKQEDDENPKPEPLLKREGGSGSASAGSPPSNLSPYAITAQMELLMKEFPNVNATVSKIGRTVEYNDIVLVRISAKKEDETYFRVKESKYIDDVPEKKIIFIVHGLTVMGLKDLTSLVKSSELKLLLSYYLKHLDKFDFFLMPLANPDGYSASLSSDRTIWNKNVSPQSVCPGVFVDRNFDVAWNSKKPISSCSQLYPGALPFSEEESKAVRDVFHRHGHKILAYIHVHAGTFDDKVFKGDAILYPRGYTQTQSDDDKYIDIKGEVDEAMKNASFRVITATVDTLSNWYGVVTGTSVDYAATVYGITYAMEFVMQLYDSESLNNNALTEIWSRLIDATFNSMWKSLQAGGDSRRFG